MNLIIGIYARVSTEEQASQGYSIQGQLRECKALAETDEVIECIDPGVSGEILERPGLNRLREYIRTGMVSKVICLDPDRLSRKLINQLILSEEFERYNAELVFVNGEYHKTPEGNLFYSLRGAISEFEKAKITERMCRGRREKARQGRVLRDFQILGYDYDSEAERLIINTAEALIVRLVFQLFTESRPDISGISGIARYLTSQGFPTKRGAKKWHRQVVRQILANRAYVGQFYQNRWRSSNAHSKQVERPQKEWILIPCPRIVDDLQFDLAGRLLEQSRRRWAGIAKHSYLLSGLVRCGLCGGKMIGYKGRKKGLDNFEYKDIRGCQQSVSQSELENFVWQQLVERILATLREGEHRAFQWREQQATQLDLLREQRALINQKIQKLKLALVKCDDGQQEVVEAVVQLKTQLAAIEQEISGSEGQLNHQAISCQTTQRRVFNEASSEEKKLVIRAVIKEIVVKNDVLEIHTF